MISMHSHRVIIQALAAPGAPDYGEAEKRNYKDGVKLRIKRNSRAACTRGQRSKYVTNFIPWQTKKMRNRPSRRADFLCFGTSGVHDSSRILSPEMNSHLWSSDYIKPTSQARSCIVELSPWQVKKRINDLKSNSRALENDVITGEHADVVSVARKSPSDKGTSSELQVNTCYEGDVVMNSSNIGVSLLKHICEQEIETKKCNPSETSYTGHDVETSCNGCIDTSKVCLSVNSDLKSVSQVINMDERLSNADITLIGESSDFIEATDFSIETRSPRRVCPRPRMLITYSRKRRKNSRAPESVLPAIMEDAGSSFVSLEGKTKSTYSDHGHSVPVGSSCCFDNLDKEVMTRDGTSVGVQHILVEKAAGESSCVGPWEEEEELQVDNPIEKIKSFVSSVKDECRIDIEAENFEAEKRNETDTSKNVACDVEFGKESSNYQGPYDLGDSHETCGMITTSELLNREIIPRSGVLVPYYRKRKNNSSVFASSLPAIVEDDSSFFAILESNSDHEHSVPVGTSCRFDSLRDEVITRDGSTSVGLQQIIMEKAAGESSCVESWDRKETHQMDKPIEIINSFVPSAKDECQIGTEVRDVEEANRNKIDAIKNLACDTESATQSYTRPCHFEASNDMRATNELLNGKRQSLSEGSSSLSGSRAFVDGKTQIINVGIIPPLRRALTGRSSKKLLVLDVNGLLADIVPLQQVHFSFKVDAVVSGKAVFKRHFHDDFLQFCFERFNVGVWSSRTKRNMELVLDILLGNAKEKLLFRWDQSHCTDTGFPVVGKSRGKPIILKKLKKLWEKDDEDLPWERGEYDESNTLLLDDSPHKALCNPPNTAIFPNTYHYMDEDDDALGPEGDLRAYLEGLSMAEDVQKYVESNPFGQRPITERNVSWRYYRNVIEAATYRSEHRRDRFPTYRSEHRNDRLPTYRSEHRHDRFPTYRSEDHTNRFPTYRSEDHSNRFPTYRSEHYSNRFPTYQSEHRSNRFPTYRPEHRSNRFPNRPEHRSNRFPTDRR